MAEPSLDEVYQLASLLQEAWESPSSAMMGFQKRGERPNPGRFALVFGLAAHTHEVAVSALLLWRQGHQLAAMPLIRAAWESAISAQWVAQAADGAQALLAESARQHVAAAVTYIKAGVREIAEAGARMIAEDYAEEQLTSSRPQGRNFQRLCEDFNGGPVLYAYYRYMSAYIHPRATVVDQYLSPSATGDGIAALRTEPRFDDEQREFSSPALPFFAPWSMILAARAVDFIDKSHHRRSQLRKLSKDLGVDSELHLTAEAERRIRAEIRNRRR